MSLHSACTGRALSGVRTAGALHVVHHITHSIVHGVIQQAWIVGGICLAAIALQAAAMLPEMRLSRHVFAGTSPWACPPVGVIDQRCTTAMPARSTHTIVHADRMFYARCCGDRGASAGLPATQR
ncbi:hypothetical protein VC218_00695 [Xanthomonas nasturtii]|uniref:hypothetical protein n=1 Tax=Xanthomonas nasturtii TaxID=1843581 RepID=UPI002B23DAE8|nr:hypothetical protein [Xanthomonas nasturtii]MEA9577484.1 hypothetical protein [Xanthomonas nasturtii]